MKPIGLRTMDEAADEIELLQQKLEFADFEWNRAIEEMQKRDNRIEKLETALRKIAEWPSSSRIDDIVNAFIDAKLFARAALDKDVTL